MSESTGIQSALEDNMSLENKIEIRLKRVLNDPQTTNRYTDRQDKQNSLRRELILAALAAIFQHRNNQSVDDSGGATVLVEDELEMANLLANQFSSVYSEPDVSLPSAEFLS